jgi:hypothetical protein
MNFSEEQITKSGPKIRKVTKQGVSKANEILARQGKNMTLSEEPGKEQNVTVELETSRKKPGPLTHERKVVNTSIPEFEKKEVPVERSGVSENSNILQVEQIAEKAKTEDTYSGRLGKESFRIDFYPSEADYTGIVSYVRSNYTPIHDEPIQTSFTGIDNKAISDFIHEHLPLPENSAVLSTQAIPETDINPQITQIQAVKTAQIGKFTPVRENMNQKESIRHDRTFQVIVVVDPQGSFTEDQPCTLTISVLAKRIGGGFKQIIGKTTRQFTTASELAANVHCAPLSAGIYRFVAFGTIDKKYDGGESIVQFHDSSLFKVT